LVQLRKAKRFRKRFKVEITETLQKVVEIMAYSPDEAIAEVTKQYDEGEIVLSSSDFIDSSIGILR